jgi:hypothetical protein
MVDYKCQRFDDYAIWSRKTAISSGSHLSGVQRLMSSRMCWQKIAERAVKAGDCLCDEAEVVVEARTKYYNGERLHSSLSYMWPGEFERNWRRAKLHQPSQNAAILPH